MLRALLFGTGRFDDARRGELQAEGVLLTVEGLKGSLTLRHYRGPDRYASWRKEGLFAALAITQRRVTADRRGGRTFLDVPFDHPGVAGMTAGVEGGRTLVITWDCGQLDDRRSGTQELRIGTPDAERAAALLHERGLRPATAG